VGAFWRRAGPRSAMVAEERKKELGRRGRWVPRVGWWVSAGVVSLMRVHGVGKAMSNNKKHYDIGRNALQIMIFMVVLTFWSSRYLTGGFGVRGKAGPNWVRKVFNCVPSL
jgi:cellobiose-specific phosphotransferase system component IIC